MKRVLAAAAACAALCACNPAPAPNAHPSASPTPAPTATNGLPPLRIAGRGSKKHPATITERENGRVVYRLVADSFEGTSSLAQATFRNARVSFIDRSGSQLDAQAPQTFLDEKRKQVTMSGGVHAQTNNGRTLTCDQLVYDRGSAKIHAEGNVVITDNQNGSQAAAHANVLDSDLSLTRMSLR